MSRQSSFHRHPEACNRSLERGPSAGAQGRGDDSDEVSNPLLREHLTRLRSGRRRRRRRQSQDVPRPQAPPVQTAAVLLVLFGMGLGLLLTAVVVFGYFMLRS